jgi:hypothetical protein
MLFLFFSKKIGRNFETKKNEESLAISYIRRNFEEG